MVEMNEVSNIIKTQQKSQSNNIRWGRRGTSTYDGLSIAWAIIEYIAKDIK